MDISLQPQSAELSHVLMPLDQICQQSSPEIVAVLCAVFSRLPWPGSFCRWSEGVQEDDDSLFRLQRPDRVRDSTPRPECEGKKEAPLARPSARGPGPLC